ncbi:DUF6457 domain-containing protein [Janibacter indicus]|uniref:DUF6457 domain-containing protein n=1 Tax=Janibacter indicus TaxID=857417 RepID=A0A1W2CGK7_9MICO|nr:DUF6457 domain-containing protein [Janibacter indicus]SMC84301.1 hypothetical protein SAMN06296429_111108 [Janibacter indicus]
MSPRTDDQQAQERWADWIERACAALGLDPEAVDVRSILDTTRTIAHGVERPMAPVGAYILGLAVGRLQEQGRPVDLESLRSHLESTLPPASRTEQA